MNLMSVRDREKIVIYSRSEDGHRASYIRFVSALIPCRRGGIMDMFFSRAPLFFLMIEDRFELYAVAALWRACLGLRTVGILMRPKPALEGRTLRLRIKRAVLKVLRRVPTVRTMTIVPFSLQPEFATIADDWLYDFQLWDLTERERRISSAMHDGEQAAGDLSRSVRTSGTGRQIICALGAQNIGKGFDIFARTFVEDGDVRAKFQFVSGGRVEPALEDLADRLTDAGGVVIDRYISDDELVELYASSDLVWALYAEDYDQASGILGRAAQLGIPAVVRTGSLSHRLCQTENLPHVDLTEQTLHGLTSVNIKRDAANGRAVAERFRTASMHRLNTAFGLASAKMSIR